MKITRFVTEYLLPLVICRCYGKVNAGQPRAGAYPGSISYGLGVNTAAVLLSSYGNVPSERAREAARHAVSAGFMDLASERLSARLQGAGFDDAMEAALEKEPVLAADESRQPRGLARRAARSGRGRASRARHPHPASRPDRRRDPHEEPSAAELCPLLSA